jgi:putative transposase
MNITVHLLSQSKGIEYKVVNEAYTSKVCTNCGNYKKDLGSAKVYNCKKCKAIIDRDVNGARNILLKEIK